MKKLALVLLVAIGLAAPAAAGQIQVGYSGSNYGPYQTGSGGEFTLNVYTSGLDTGGYATGVTSNIGVTGTFQTFCIQGTEYIYPYSSTYYAELNAKAMYGDDPVSVGTGWLYSQFATGNWQDGLTYNYGANRSTSADLLQKALWWLEGEEGLSYDASNPYMAAVVAEFGSQTAAKADGGWNYGVYALNLWTNSDQTGPIQDQLFYQVPDGGTTLMLLGGALVGLGALRRKFRG